LSRFVFAANKSLIVSRNPQHRNEAVWFTGGGSPIAHVNLLNSRDGSCRRYYAFSKSVYTTTKTTILFRIELIH
jgi:hypothetical protein